MKELQVIAGYDSIVEIFSINNGYIFVPLFESMTVAKQTFMFILYVHAQLLTRGNLCWCSDCTLQLFVTLS